MLPSIRKASPPNIRISVTFGSPDMSSRMRLARSSSYAMATSFRSSLFAGPQAPQGGTHGAIEGEPLGGREEGSSHPQAKRGEGHLGEEQQPLDVDEDGPAGGRQEGGCHAADARGEEQRSAGQDCGGARGRERRDRGEGGRRGRQERDQGCGQSRRGCARRRQEEALV